ncbi:MAG: MFS transporter [Chitinophagales bacterium]|nr:MFS transporter [Chitinophagales bacterium]MDW8428068.1 MFS transporter [Chitinophagales bacterium]
MSFGFLGIQFGFALQNGNASRILQTFGADVEHLSWFWLVAPLTGMIIQPLVGYFSDRTWTALGRRRPYFLAGAILASMGLMFMPNASLLAGLLPALYIGAGILMIMDASFNIAMEPFRALVADNLPDEQRTTGFAVQTFLIGIGAVVGSWLPYVFAEWLGIAKTAAVGEVPENVKMAFYFGAVVFLIAILWTVITTKEFPPEEYKKYFGDEEQRERYNPFRQIVSDFAHMPRTMKQLGVVQFFSWFALFSMWVFTTPALATHHYGLAVDDVHSARFQDAGNWVGILFGVYNGVAAVFALFLPAIAARIGRRRTHFYALLVGGLGLMSMYVIRDPQWLLLSMVAVGVAWASILAMPYAILAGAIPSGKMGIYMGIFNFFITFPQIVNGLIGGPMVKYAYGNQPIYALVAAGVLLVLAAVSVLRVEDRGDRRFGNR